MLHHYAPHPTLTATIASVARLIASNSRLLLAMSLTGMASSAVGQTFAPVVAYPTGGAGTPYKVVAADVNGDGRPDAIVANSTTSTVGVLLGNGDGTFRTVTTYSVGANRLPYSVAVADVNGDSWPDIVTANNVLNFGVSVLLGNGNGTFRAAVSYPVGAYSFPTGVAIADTDGDRRLDIVVVGTFVFAGTTEAFAKVLPGLSNGTFGSARTFSAGLIAPRDLVMADVNRDGRLDIVTETPGRGAANVLLNSANNGFQQGVEYALGAGSRPFAVAVADVNGDARVDIVTANNGTASVGVLLNNGSGAFLPAMSYPLPSGNQPTSAALADVTGDGRPDFLTTIFNTGEVAVLPGNGNGTFQPAVAFATGASPGSVAVADLNGDGRADVLTANRSANTLGVLLNSGTFLVLAARPGSASPRSAFKLSPNPTHHYTTTTLTLAAPQAQPAVVEVFDAVGRLVQQLPIPAGRATAALDIASLPAGLYLVRCAGAIGRLTVE
ncbi:T9SS type A sorting domain-containing protein [Hymenobacter sp. BT683]|uniref:T9SS type A sorting domain-containing protein n=1 Tax=Hymenobacter jeongseonensis TaxID=2791027 RepID=A0ABS0IN56_9BACT|nr:T9SS type A sorting domain-containing protein [Hymenobacter jeongseonensis]MBF9239807.1 T9SS type A sorting domain-containing protein [Hymenobacter jeongseonensis]